MKRFFISTILPFFALSLSAVDSRLELPHISDDERAAFKDMQSDSSGNRAAGAGYLVDRGSSLLNNLRVIEDVDGALLYKDRLQHFLKSKKSALGTGEFIVLNEGHELPLEFYPCIIVGRTARPTHEELKTLYMPCQLLGHDDNAKSEGSDSVVSDGDESQVEKEDECPGASEGSEDEPHEQTEALLSTEDGEVKPTLCSRKRKRNADAVRRTMKRSAVVRGNSVTIPCEIGTETLVTRVSKRKYKVQVWPLA